MNKKYVVDLTEEERDELTGIVSTGEHSARRIRWAHVLLKADAGWTDERICEAFLVSLPTVQRIRQRFAEEGMDVALGARSIKPRPYARKLDGEQEAHLIALACSEAPEGCTRWTLRMLAGKMVALEYVDSLSHETVRQVLKNEIKPWLVKEWCIAPAASAEFVWKMEDVLEVYTRPFDAERPLVCMDETSKQQIMEVRTPMKQAPGREYRYDSEYKRNGVSNLFMFFAPCEGWRHVKVTDRRTKIDWAYSIRELVDEHFPCAKRITLVMDNLNTHCPSSLYEAFAPVEARRILSRLELHYTPKHGSWLNMAEIELSILSRQCLSRRIPDQQKLRHEVAAWEKARNAKSSSIDWRFTTDDARIKLKKLYPSFGE